MVVGCIQARPWGRWANSGSLSSFGRELGVVGFYLGSLVLFGRSLGVVDFILGAPWVLLSSLRFVLFSHARTWGRRVHLDSL